jgi:hypothetical protein
MDDRGLNRLGRAQLERMARQLGIRRFKNFDTPGLCAR